VTTVARHVGVFHTVLVQGGVKSLGALSGRATAPALKKPNWLKSSTCLTQRPTIPSSAARQSGGQALHSAFRDFIGANYFSTLGVPLLGGREFDGRDQQQEEPGPQTPFRLSSIRQPHTSCSAAGTPLAGASARASGTTRWLA